MSVRILIGSRSRAFGRGLAECLERGGDIAVVGIFDDAAGLVSGAARERPDLVAVDFDLPGGGEGAVRRIMRERPTRLVMIVTREQRRSVRAAPLDDGVVGVVPRSAVPLDAPDGAAADALRRRFRRLSVVRLGNGSGQAPVLSVDRSPPFATGPPRGAYRAQVVGICASTGGPEALVRVLRELPAEFGIPVLVVQHMSPGFVDGLARWLDAEVALDVAVASTHEPLGPGVRLAPDGAHLTVGAGRTLELDRATVNGSHRPSGDVLLSSLAKVFRASAVAVVLTGMGRDGAAGLAEVAAAGGRTIAQDEASSTIFGMPRAAADRGARTILPLDAIGLELARLRGPVAR